MNTMAIFRTLIDINDGLRDLVKEVELYFSIKLEKEVIDKIFNDSEEDQVNAKAYLLFQGEKKLLRRELIIRGVVDEYEPHDIWIEIQDLKEKDIKYLNELVSR